MQLRSRLEIHSIINGSPARQILAAATDVSVKETLNGQFFVTFSYPRLSDDNARYDAIQEAAEVRFPDDMTDEGIAGQYFVIKSVTEERRGLRVYKQVEAHHIAFDLNRYFYDGYIDFLAAQMPEYQLGLLAVGTPYTFVIEGAFSADDIFEWGEKRRFDLLGEVRTLYNGELTFDNTEITLTTRRGMNWGVEIRYRKNLTGITRKSHDMERITRLYGYGKNGLTIEGLPGHSVKYIDSEYIDVDHVYEGSVEFAEIEDQVRLLDAMQRYLRENELPKVSYEIDFVELEKVDVDFQAEAIRSVGDTVTVIDELMGYRFEARVIEYERYPFEARRARVVLANFRELKSSDYVFQATVGSRRAVTYTSRNAVLKGVQYDDSITLVDGFGMRVADDANRTMVRLGQTAPGEYGLALYNKAGTRTIWQDSGTGNAYFSGTITAGTIIGGTIQGAAIIAGTITGSTIETASPGIFPRTEMSASDVLFGVYTSATRRIRMRATSLVHVHPYMEFMSDVATAEISLVDGNFDFRSTGNITIGGSKDVSFNGVGDVDFNMLGYAHLPFNKLRDSYSGDTLDQELAGKANAFSGVTGNFNVGDWTFSFTNGVCVSVF